MPKKVMMKLYLSVLEDYAVELWSCFFVMNYVSFLWLGRVSFRAWLMIGASLLIAVALGCLLRKRGRRPAKTSPVIRRAWLDEEGNLRWSDDNVDR